MDNVVLCGSSAYEKKYYLNPDYEGLPREVKKDLKMICVSYTEEIGGIFTMEYRPDGRLILKVESRDGDFDFDEIGSDLKIKQIRTKYGELMEALELYHKIIIEAKKDS
jgi:hypothetical protein